uniref:Protein kinase domain-containing protein n=1 Tax=Globodera rostochiensis TaxID=31243 RepID=A0A914HM57_GLORO
MKNCIDTSRSVFVENGIFGNGIFYGEIWCLAGPALLGNAASSSELSLSRESHKNGFFGQPLVQRSTGNDAKFGHISMPKLTTSKSLKLSSSLKASSKMLVFPQQKKAGVHSDSVPFALYWTEVLDHFDGKVPTQTIANILCRLIDAFKQSNGGTEFDVITTKIDFDGILTPEHFVAIKSIVASKFNDAELLGDVNLVFEKIDVPRNLQLAYKSPEQLLHKTNISADEDIVWSLGIVLFTVLSNRHPLEQLAVEHLNMAQDIAKLTNGAPLNTVSVDLGTVLTEATEDLEPKWRAMVAKLVESGQEFPISLKAGEHDQLVLLAKQCLQMQKDKRISLHRMRRILKEIVEYENSTEDEHH